MYPCEQAAVEDTQGFCLVAQVFARDHDIFRVRACTFVVVLLWSQLVIDGSLEIMCCSHSTIPTQWMDVVLLPTIYETEFYNGKVFGLNGGDTDNYQGYDTHPRACTRTHMHSHTPMKFYSNPRTHSRPLQVLH